MSRVSAIICTRGRPDMIAGAVDSVLRNEHDSFELIVVDQSADKSTESALAELLQDSRLRYFHTHRVGLSYAYNLGIKLAVAPLLAFTDDDCIAPPQWLAAVERAFERHPDVEMLYGQTRAAQALEGAPGILPSLLIQSEEKLGQGVGFRIYGMGADFALRRSLVERIGGFDEALGGGGALKSSQDFDYQFRAYRAGAVCLLTPDVWVDHYGIRAGEAWASTMLSYGVGDGAFLLKHVRCGDMLALRILIARFGRRFLAEFANPLRGRPSQWPYVWGCLKGMRDSFRFKIDRKRRLYELTGSS